MIRFWLSVGGNRRRKKEEVGVCVRCTGECACLLYSLEAAMLPIAPALDGVVGKRKPQARWKKIRAIVRSDGLAATGYYLLEE